MFKFEYRRALDTRADYERKNQRMIDNQKARFEEKGYNQLVENYLREPSKYENEYLTMLTKESINQYADYFETDKDELEMEVLEANQHKFAVIFENWTIDRIDRSTYKTFTMPKWNYELGLWNNSLKVLQEVQAVGDNMALLEAKHSADTLSASSIKKKE